MRRGRVRRCSGWRGRGGTRAACDRPSTSRTQTAPMDGDVPGPGVTIGREGLLRLVAVVERLRARESGGGEDPCPTRGTAAPECGGAEWVLGGVPGEQPAEGDPGTGAPDEPRAGGGG